MNREHQLTTENLGFERKNPDRVEFKRSGYEYYADQSDYQPLQQGILNYRYRSFEDITSPPSPYQWCEYTGEWNGIEVVPKLTNSYFRIANVRLGVLPRQISSVTYMDFSPYYSMNGNNCVSRSPYSLVVFSAQGDIGTAGRSYHQVWGSSTATHTTRLEVELTAERE